MSTEKIIKIRKDGNDLFPITLAQGVMYNRKPLSDELEVLENKKSLQIKTETTEFSDDAVISIKAGENISITGNTVDDTITITGTTPLLYAGDNIDISDNKISALGYTWDPDNYSYSEGIHSTATGLDSHAEGYGKASGSISHAEGYNTTAAGAYSHAEGQNTIAFGSGSHAEGLGSHTNYRIPGSFIGYIYNCGDTKTIEDPEEGTISVKSFYLLCTNFGCQIGAHIIDSYHGNSTIYKIYDIELTPGNSIIKIYLPPYVTFPGGLYLCYIVSGAHGGYSHTEGKMTTALADGGHAQGNYNLANASHLVEVGNGMYQYNLNVYTLDLYGKSWFALDVKIGGDEYNPAFSIKNDLLTEAIVDGNISYNIPASYNWRLSSIASNPDSSKYLGVYESYSNSGSSFSYTYSYFYIYVKDVSSLTLYIRGDFEANSKMYVQVGRIKNGYIDLATTVYSGRPYSTDTSINGYTPITIDNFYEGTNQIAIYFQRANPTAVGTDRAYLLLPITGKVYQYTPKFGLASDITEIKDLIGDINTALAEIIG